MSTINTEHRNLLASGLDKAGRLLTYPANLLLDQVARTVRPIKPGHFDQLDSTSKELVMRVFRAVLCVFFSPLILLGIIGNGFQAIASFSRSQFVVICPEQQVQPPPGTIQKLKICTFNACWMPNWINIFVHNYSVAQDRLKAAVQGAIDTDADVLCIQEAFHTEATSEFVGRIRHKYPHIVYNPGYRSFGLGSGLLIASKFPLKNPQYWEHGNKIGTERLSGKGSLAVTVQPSQEQEIPVINTHLEAGLDDATAAVPCRVKQLQDLKRHATEYCKGFDASFVCGDMNISSTGTAEDLVQLKEIITVNPRDQGTLFVKHEPVHEKKDCDCTCETMNQEDVDHIGVLKPSRISPTPLESRVDCFYRASDHAAYIATFDLRTQANADDPSQAG